ncbi:MAG: GNAT family N-acetyltransferase [Candidatus Brennerbacteria bacterium]|nr:GNAT family N-acetyltransferase [Candidatus Brennerbacteria bacterium]
MIIRDFQKNDLESSEEISTLYWNDLEFLKELSDTLKMYINQTEECINEKYRFFVAEEKGEIVGIAGFRNAPDYLRQHAKTNNPAELYIIAVKYKGRGIGKELRLKILEEGKNIGFTEIILYSPNSHEKSWVFYEKSGFERIGEITAPDGEPGQVWQKLYR